MDEISGDRSILKDAAMRIGALNWGMFFQAQPDTVGKLAAFEHLEIGGYEQLRRVAERARHDSTLQTPERILAEERHAAETLVRAFDASVDAALGAQVAR